MPTNPKKRGRPALPESERKSRNLTFRARGDLRDRLLRSANESGRSMSEEIEFQLEQGFERGQWMAVMLGQRLAGLVSLISSAIINVQQDTGGRLDTDAFTAVVTEGVVRRLCHEYFKVPSAPPLTAEQLAEAEERPWNGLRGISKDSGTWCPGMLHPCRTDPPMFFEDH